MKESQGTRPRSISALLWAVEAKDLVMDVIEWRGLDNFLVDDPGNMSCSGVDKPDRHTKPHGD